MYTHTTSIEKKYDETYVVPNANSDWSRLSHRWEVQVHPPRCSCIDASRKTQFLHPFLILPRRINHPTCPGRTNKLSHLRQFWGWIRHVPWVLWDRIRRINVIKARVGDDSESGGGRPLGCSSNTFTESNRFIFVIRVDSSGYRPRTRQTIQLHM